MGYDSGAWTSDPQIAFANHYAPQGIGADMIATLDGYTREDVDNFAVESQRRAAESWEEGRFKGAIVPVKDRIGEVRSEEHTSELQSLMRISYAVFCLKKTTNNETP